MHIYLYGPPGSGKSTLGKSLAAALDRGFIDLDQVIEQSAGKSIPAIFQEEGEARFRQIELDCLKKQLGERPAVIALGGGALIEPAARETAKSNGKILCLDASLETILSRLENTDHGRPLLSGDTGKRLEKLLRDREEHYASFPLRLENNHRSLEDLTWQAQLLSGIFHISGMGQPYDVCVDPGGLERVGRYLRERSLNGPVAVITDQNVKTLYGDRLAAGLEASGYQTSVFAIQPGEDYKNIQTVIEIWNHLIEAKIERGSTILSLGGGVVGDMAGFAAATFVRGVAWVNLPTTLLAMVDSSLGGKTGIDLPQAKNMVGAFHSPRLVLADPVVLASLPDRELRNGMAETIKHGVISDPDLFDFCSNGLEHARQHLDWIVRHSMAVKVRVVQQDPYEKGHRQALNLGHTVGHGVETVSNFALSHGECVAIGMLVEARIAEQLGLAEKGTANRIRLALEGVGLPVRIPESIPMDAVIEVMQHDKKRMAGKVRFALPERIGSVLTGVLVEGWQSHITLPPVAEE